MKNYWMAALFAMAVGTGCSGSSAPQLEGTYVGNVGELTFETTTIARLDIMGTKPFSGQFRNAQYVRKGDTLTLTSRPGHKGQYQIIYTFDVINDGAQLQMDTITTEDAQAGSKETIDAPGAEADLTFSKRL